MLRDVLDQMKTAFIVLVILTLLTGVAYPLFVTACAQLFFPWQANGSLIEQQGKTKGSLLIGQYFSSPGYFWGRPSATDLFPYNATASSGSNSGPTNPLFIKTVKARVAFLNAEGGHQQQPFIPVDLVTASGSGLDPDISPYAAFYQASRVAKARHLPQKKIQQLIQQHIQQRTFYILGEPRVNVLALNLALDQLGDSQ